MQKIILDESHAVLNGEKIDFVKKTNEIILKDLVSKIIDPEVIILNQQSTYFPNIADFGQGKFNLQKKLEETFNIEVAFIKEDLSNDILHLEFLKQVEENRWIVSYYGIDKTKKEQSIQTILTLGNGYFAVRGKPLEDDSYYGASYIAGLFNKVNTKIAGKEIYNEDFVNIGSFFDYEIEILGEILDFENSNIEIKRDLNLLKGTLETTIFWDLHGRVTKIYSKKIISMSNRNLALLDYVITPINHNHDISIRHVSNFNVVNKGVQRYKDLTNKHLNLIDYDIRMSVAKDIENIVYETTESAIKVKVLNAIEALDKNIFKTFHKEGYKSVIYYTIPSQKQRSIRLRQKTVIYSSNLNSQKEFLDLKINSVDFSEEQLRSEKAWEDIFDEYNIKLKGNLLLNKALKINIFHLHSSYSKNTIGIDSSIAARGLHGEAYRGHVFWDDIYISGFYLHHDSEISKNMLMYRYNRLNAARENARKNGYKGAMFPWQSGRIGDEQTQTIHLNPLDNSWVDDYSTLQRHVSLAICYDIIRYVQETSDFDFLVNYGYEMLIEVSRFFLSLTSINEDGEKYSINGVMGPDEFHEKYADSKKGGLNNNAYTNIFVAWLFNKVGNIVIQFNLQDRLDDLDKIEKTLSITEEELLKLKEVSENLSISIKDGILEQYDGFSELKELDLDFYKGKYGNIQRMDRILKSENKNINEYKVNKQADTMMLFFLFSDDELEEIFKQLGFKGFSKKFIYDNFQYYLKITTHGSTLSRITYSSIAAKLGKIKIAEKLFMEAAISDYIDIQEGTTAEGIHAGVMAATITEIYRTYLGIDFQKKKINIKPKIPKAWKNIEFKINFKGKKYLINKAGVKNAK